MASRLTEHINSAYLDAANRLKPKSAKRRVVAYVESYDDVLFWRQVLQEYESEQLRFEVMLPSRTSLGKGKKLALTNHLGMGQLGQCMIACVDADYDYLMQGCTDHSKLMLTNPYVFHTYVYAIESYQCYAPGLHEACVMATLNDREVIDLEAFMTEVSVILWPLLVWSVWCYRNGGYKQFSLADLAETIALRDVNTYHPEQSLDYLRRHVNKRISWLQHRFPQARKTYASLRDELQRLGVTPQTAYLYVQGHTLFDNVVIPLVGPVCTLLRRERENEIKRLACHETQLQNELSCYQHSILPIEMMLKKNTLFRESAPYQQLRADLQRFVSNLQRFVSDPNSAL